jgi:hypothetical protein
VLWRLVTIEDVVVVVVVVVVGCIAFCEMHF